LPRGNYEKKDKDLATGITRTTKKNVQESPTQPGKNPVLLVKELLEIY